MSSFTVLQARSLRQRTVTNENDENATSTRLTRAKAAALTATDLNGGAIKKPLQSKRATATTTTTAAQKRRPALGDVSNVTKTDLVDAKDGKKAATKASLTSKSTTQAGGVQKLSRSNTTRAALGVKDTNKKAAATEVKRPGSGSGVKRSSSQKSIRDDLNPEEPPRKKVEVEKKKAEVVQQQIVSENVSEGGVDVVNEKDLEAEGILDLDTEDLDDPLMAAEYVVDIFDYLKDLEHETLPSPDYIDHQPELEWKMRGILIDWLIEVHASFRLLPETLFLTVNIIDRFLSAEIVSLDRLQLVGVTAMFIASKYEEVLSPHVANFSQVADETFSDKEILDAERHVLATLNYNMSYPNPMNFLRRISKADNYDIHTRTLGKYLMEISLLDHNFMPYKQSHVAAAAMYLARLILDRPGWDATLAHYSGYTEEEIQPVFLLMVDYLHRSVAHEAFFKKYASKKFLKASIVSRQWAKRYHADYLGGQSVEAQKQ